MQTQALKRASGYPIGGCRVIPQSFLDVLATNGGTIKKNSPVRRIIIENNTATGVELVSGEAIRADIVISNVDVSSTVFDLVGEKYFPPDYTDRIRGAEFTPAAFLLKFALNEKITDEKFIMFVAHPNVDEYLQMIESGKVPERVNLMIPVISNLDPTTAPPDKQLIIAGTFPAMKPDWKAWEKAVMDSVKMVFPDIEKHILFTEVTNREDVDKLVGEGGSTIGLAQTVDQVGDKRISQMTPVKNLYLVGSEAGGWGIGTELAANSALELYGMIP
jgi:prolycopene isomerase